MKYLFSSITLLLALALMASADDINKGSFNMIKPALKVLPKGQYLKNNILFKKSLDNHPDWQYDSSRKVWWRVEPYRPCPPSRP